MSNDVHVNAEYLLISLNSTVGDKIAAAFIRTARDTAQQNLHDTLQRAVKAGRLEAHHDEEVREDLEILAACNRLLQYYGAE